MLIANSAPQPTYFTMVQQRTFEKVEGTLQKFIKDHLLAFDDLELRNLARTTLNILETCQVHSISEHFFLVLLKSYPSIDVLKKLEAIVQKNLGEIFFKCVTTQKKNYYSPKVLIEIIDQFHQLLPHLPTPCPPLIACSPYDAGGREVLAKALASPKDIVSLFSRSPSLSGFNPPAPSKRQDLLTTNFNFSKMKDESIRYLSSLDEKNRSSLGVYLEVFRYLQDLRELTELEKKGILRLIIAATTDETHPIPMKYTKNDLIELIRELQTLHDYGEEFVIYFCHSPHLGTHLDDIIHAINHLNFGLRDYENFDKLIELVQNFHAGTLTLSVLLKTLEAQIPYSNEKDVEDDVPLDTLIDRFSGKIKDPSVVFPLSEENAAKVKKQYLVVYSYCKKWYRLRLGELVNKASQLAAKAEKKPLNEDEIFQLCAIGRLAIRKIFKIYLYNTQVCAVLGKLLFIKGAVAKINTGEGKTLESMLLAFVLVMTYSTRQGHIISSDHTLATRDQEDAADFFRTFSVSTAHICGDHHDTSYFKARILWGTATDFEFALMREQLYREKLFPDPFIAPRQGKRFKWVIIDELDNLSIDTSMNGARLSHPAEVTHDWVYIPILDFVKANTTKKGAFTISPDQLLGKLKSYLKGYKNGKYSYSLEKLEDQKLLRWLHSAKTALYEKAERRDYLIRPIDNRKGEKVLGILIVDVNNTGKLQHGMRWSHGIHEFVEAKHGLEIQREDICPIALSHPVYYEMYDIKYGVTGTAGDKIERDELMTIYGLPSFDVPTHRPPQRKDHPTIIFATLDQLLQAAVSKIRECTEARRPIMAIRSSIGETEELGKRLGEQGIFFELLNEAQQKKDKDILEGAGLPGAALVATPTATRGTNIKLAVQSIHNGGLFVLILSYFISIRVEMQARGRGGRQGEPGDSITYLCKELLVKEFPEIEAMSDDEILQFLEKQRQTHAFVQKDTHHSYATVERFSYNLVLEFYQLLNHFHDIASKEIFQQKVAAFLNNRKLLKPDPKEFDHLSPKKKLIAQEALKLLSTETDCTMKWKILVGQVIERIHHAMINDFAINFYAKIQELVADSGITSLSSRALKAKQIWNEMMGIDISAIIDLQFQKDSVTLIEQIKKDIEDLFAKQMNLWIKYLDISGRGILLYLSKILEIDLTPLASDTQFPVTYKVGENDSINLDSDFEMHASFGARGLRDVLGGLPNSGVPGLGAAFGKPDGNGSHHYSGPLGPSKPWFEVDDKDIVIPEYVPGTPLPAPPSAGIRVPLNNFGNTCWLNSIVKFIACTNFYDEMLSQPVQYKRLQGFLREIVISLRTGKGIADIFFKAFLNELRKLMPQIPIGRQNDAPEFLIQLTRLLQWKPVLANQLETETYNKLEIYPQLGMTYQATTHLPEGWTKFPTVNNFCTEVMVTIPEDFNGDLDLATLIMERGRRMIRPDKLNQNTPGTQNEMEFMSTTHFITLPSLMMVYIKRFISDKSGQNRKKLNNLMALDRNQQIGFRRFDVVYQQIAGKPVPQQFVQREMCYYRIGAAVEHLGELGGGHYICWERAANGAHIKHDDHVITESQTPNYVAGYFLRLDRI